MERIRDTQSFLAQEKLYLLLFSPTGNNSELDSEYVPTTDMVAVTVLFSAFAAETPKLLVNVKAKKIETTLRLR
jgi:hypothetical protein